MKDSYGYIAANYVWKNSLEYISWRKPKKRKTITTATPKNFEYETTTFRLARNLKE